MNGRQAQNWGESSSSTSTSLSSQQDVDDDQMIALVLSEEYANLDGAVGRRLSNLAPVPVRIPAFSVMLHSLTVKFDLFYGLIVQVCNYQFLFLLFKSLAIKPIMYFSC